MSQQTFKEEKRFPRPYVSHKWLRYALIGLLGLALLCVFLPFWRSKAKAAVTNPGNLAVQYANTHWNWDWDSTDSLDYYTVNAGNGQPNFECAEFVTRALSTEGLTPGLDAYNSTSDQYANYNGYNLRLVGDLYNYLIRNRLGTDIGNNPSQAVPGDVVFYSTAAGMFHVVLLTQTGTTVDGSDTLVDGHNIAEYNQVYSPGYDEYGNVATISIVHIAMNTAPTASAAAAAMQDASGHLYTFALGTNHNIWQNHQLSRGGWSGWSELQVGGGFLGHPAVSRNADGRLEVFARGNNGNIDRKSVV